MRQQPATVPHQGAQQLVLDRRKSDLLAVATDDASREVDLYPSGQDHRFIVTHRRAPQVRVDASHELAGPEGLDDVVVRAGAERFDHPVLVRDVRQDDERHRAPLAQPPNYLRAIGVTKGHLDDRGVGDLKRSSRERIFRSLGCASEKAGIAEQHSERTERLQVAIADEDGSVLSCAAHDP
jgi:hypothetical protein